MLTYKMLVLTDHSGHSIENSLYPLVQAARQNPRCAQIDVATRANPLNDLFFKEHVSKALYVTKADESFAYHDDGRSFKKNVRRESFKAYDVVWLRLPPPLSEDFLKFLTREFPNQLIINSPKGIHEIGSKGFLTNFEELCAPMKVCRSINDIVDFKEQFPIVLKPFRDYGGKGIVRIDGNSAWMGKEMCNLDEFFKKIEGTPIEYLGVKFLKNVSMGDKRIVVVDGEVMGASLRLPAKDSWLCNVSMGGHSEKAEADMDEINIVNNINPMLTKMGIVMYGVDTLMGDNNKRVLSEINATSIGGLPAIAQQAGKPLVKVAADRIWNYICKNI